MDLDEERKQNWLERFGIQTFLAHASGHASADEIKKMVEIIDPQNLIPIHTQHPELF
ncbi:MAG: MBL fold metallo-hydrolase RNA specificity domain-containing protein [Euryarchaeota archaeon]|nr:MBL fold metallo-hydrolase RNA specificity domain-containing protein [Euryarchaeota archaeon]